MNKDDFEKLLRKSAFHGCGNLLFWIAVVAILSGFLSGVANEIGISELWKWVLLIPFGIWFMRFIQDK